MHIVEKMINLLFFCFLNIKRNKNSDDNQSIYVFSDVGDFGFRMFHLEESIIESFDNLVRLDVLDQKRQKISQLHIGSMVVFDLLSDLLGFFLVVLDTSYRFLSHFVHIFSDASS